MGNQREIIEEMAAKIAYGQRIKSKNLEVPDELAQAWFREYVRLAVKLHGVKDAQRLFAHTKGNFAEPIVREAARELGMPYRKYTPEKLFGPSRRW
jgi:hypothetical protein